MVSVVVGVVLLALGIWGLSAWWWSVTEVLRGIVPILLIIFGPIALGAGISRMREQNNTEDVNPLVVEELGG